MQEMHYDQRKNFIYWTDYLYIINNSGQEWVIKDENGAGLQISHEGTVVFLLRKLMDDLYENIDYFINELDFGRKYKPGMITDDDDEDIDLSTAEKLYDYLVRR